MTMREADRLKTIQAVVDRMARVSDNLQQKMTRPAGATQVQQTIRVLMSALCFRSTSREFR